jgi:4'-phosphopantetheinyl transferase
VLICEKNNRVQLWRARPDAPWPVEWRGLTGLLDDAEQRQAGRFRFAADRRAYVLAHGLRRLALAAWLEVPAASLRFGATASGQPRLLGAWRHPVFFSHTHNREAVLVALSEDAAVGIDVESTRGRPIDAALLAGFIALPDMAEVDAFFYWTALEAYWKAAGSGLAQGQPRLHVERCAEGLWLATPGMRMPADAAASRPTLVLTVTAPPGCCASLALHAPAGTQTLPLTGHAGWLIEEHDFASEGAALPGLPGVSEL